MAANDEVMRLDMVAKSTMEAILKAPVLPNITEADEGKTLTVEDGKPTWAEGGGGGDIVIIGYNDDTGAMTSTWKEIHDNFANHKVMVMIVGEYELSVISSVSAADGVYSVFTNNLTQIEGLYAWQTDSANGYPVVND